MGFKEWEKKLCEINCLEITSKNINKIVLTKCPDFSAMQNCNIHSACCECWENYIKEVEINVHKYK